MLDSAFPKYGVFCRKLHIHKENKASVSLFVQICELCCLISLCYFQYNYALLTNGYNTGGMVVVHTFWMSV